MAIPKHRLACWCVMFCWVAAFGVFAQEEGTRAEPGDRAPSGELTPSALAEIERLRAELDRLLSTVPDSLHDQVRELLLTPLAPSVPSEAPIAAIQEESAGATSTAEVADTSTDSTLNAAPPGMSEDAEPGEATEAATATETAATTPVTEESARVEPAIEPSKRKGPNPQTRRQTRRAVCNSLDPLDENGDGKINAQDRYWRYLYVWVDQNRDGQRQEKEVESTYAAGVREIETGLGAFYRKKGSQGEIRRRDTLLLDLAGNGFGSGRRPDDGVLMVDTDGLGRGDGPQVLDASGVVVKGIEPFEAGWQMRLSDGEVLTINCPQGGSN